jgi:PAS domain S-box-containing protein
MHERWWRQIMEHSPNLIVGVDREARIVLFNRRAEQLTGYKAEEVIGKHWVPTFIPVERREHAYLVWHDIVDHMRVDHQNENEIVTKSGERRLVNWSNMVLRDGDQLEMVLSIGTDITEHRQAEEQRALLAIAVEQTGDAVVVTDTAGTIQYVNPTFEALTGYRREEAIGQNPRILKSGKQDLGFYQNLWATITAGETWQGRMVNKRKDGSLYTEETTISPVRNAEGEIVHFVAVKRDITEHLRDSQEKARLQAQLESAQRLEAIGRLAGGVAHDFNNLLNVIKGFGELALRRLHPQDPVYQYIEQIMAAEERAERLTRQLLAFSRKQALEPEVLDLNELIRDVAKMLERLIGEDIALELHLAENLGRVLVDPGQMEQVLMNLAVNARDAMPVGGTLVIETANVTLDEAYTASHAEVEPGDYVLMAVSDTGIGMDEKVKAQIFEPFFTTKDRDRGTGLGLSTVYGIVKQSRGSIWVYSEVGQGTTFKIYLPVTEAMPEPVVEKPEEEVRAVESEASILVVEDEADLRQVIREILSHVGYKVTVAANGGEALLLVEEEGLRPDLLITDVVMPRMNGKQLVDRLRRTQPGLRVLYISGYTDNAIVHQGILDPGAPFLQKPFGLQELGDRVQQILSGEQPRPRRWQ